MALTPLHRALGLTSSPLTFSMLEQAIGQAVQEREDLDWKKETPNPQNPGASVEFAKDVAALANSGGGMIVYGVAESASVATDIVSVESWNESAEQRLRSWAYSLIQPPVHGLHFEQLTGKLSFDDADRKVIALSVPASPDAPHFVIQKGSIRAPRRYGSHTVDMSEREIEQAYRHRFEDRRAGDRALEDLLHQVTLGAHKGTKIWLCAAARPIQPRPRYTGRVDRSDAQTVLLNVGTRTPYLRQNNPLGVNYNPLPGYRKWRSVEGREFHTPVIVDLHDDGSVALAMTASQVSIVGWDDDTDVHVMEAQSLPAHICHLARTYADQLSIPGEYEISVTIQAEEPQPLFIRSFDPITKSLLDRRNLAPIHEFQPVVGLLDTAGSQANALAVVRELALDVINQGGLTSVGADYLFDNE